MIPLTINSMKVPDAGPAASVFTRTEAWTWMGKPV